MRQAEIWDIEFNPTVGQEQKDIRSAVIISGNIMNDNYELVIVCPLTSKIKNHRANIILQPNQENGFDITSEILVFYVKSVSKNRLVKFRGRINQDELDLIKINLNKLLDY